MYLKERTNSFAIFLNLGYSVLFILQITSLCHVHNRFKKTYVNIKALCRFYINSLYTKIEYLLVCINSLIV